MENNYNLVPQWWFHLLLSLVIGLALFTCEGFGGQLQFPYWGVLLAIGIALIFTLPISVITATRKAGTRYFINALFRYAPFSTLRSCNIQITVHSNQD